MRAVTVQEAVAKLVRRPVRKKSKQQAGVSYFNGGGKSQPRDMEKEAKLAALVRARRAQGLPATQPTAWPTPSRRVLALQVRNNRDPEWGILKGETVFQETSDRRRAEITEQLEHVQVGWLICDYFGSDAQFRIAEVFVAGTENIY